MGRKTFYGPRGWDGWSNYNCLLLCGNAFRFFLCVVSEYAEVIEDGVGHRGNAWGGLLSLLLLLLVLLRDGEDREQKREGNEY